MKLFLTVLLALSPLMTSAHSGSMHEMQHGFVLASDDRFASHLVAPGHHSRQTEVIGTLAITSRQEAAHYAKRKLAGQASYFLFQAQNLDLPSLKNGQVLVGHIVESPLGAYEPRNIIVKQAAFKVERVLLNIPNPFFQEAPHARK